MGGVDFIFVLLFLGGWFIRGFGVELGFGLGYGWRVRGRGFVFGGS